MIHPATSVSGSCWFCGRQPAGEDSVVYPFVSVDGDAVTTIVVPRCAACMSIHVAQIRPTSAVVLCAAIVPPVLTSLFAPVPESLRTPLSVLALIAGLIGGIVLVGQFERRRAAKHGTRPDYDAVEYPAYQAIAADSAHWRSQRPSDVKSGVSTSTVFRCRTVADYRSRYAADAAMLAALDAGCREAGIAA